MIDRRFINLVTAIYVIAVLVIAFSANWLVSPAGPELLPTAATAKLKDPSEKALGLAADMIKHVTTLSTGLIAVAIWLLKRPLTDEGELRQRIIFVSMAIVALSASLYFGFMSMDGMLAMITFGAFDAQNDMIWRPQTLQYYSFVVGALVLGLACVRCLNAIRDAK